MLDVDPEVTEPSLDTWQIRQFTFLCTKQDLRVLEVVVGS